MTPINDHLQFTGNQRTSNRNITYLKCFGERIIYSSKLRSHSKSLDDNELDLIIQTWATPKQIDAYFDKFTIAFGKWLLQRTPRTLEHSMEELLADFREYQSTAPDDQQIDNIKEEQETATTT